MADIKVLPCPRCLPKRKDFDPSSRFCRWCSGTGFALASYVCNGCGETIVNEMNILGLPSVSVEGAYESWHLFDLTRYEFALCEKCLRALFDRLLIPPALNDYGDGSEIPYAEDRKAYQDRLDKRAKLGSKP